MLGDFASLDVQNTYRGSDAYESCVSAFPKNMAFPFYGQHTRESTAGSHEIQSMR
ncbi:hypothetical protein [Piscirickettsia salmonis]|uniref:hypothetical protein n=1 Tax=Piscirickettsia salmonis TaxID=1238 RepID=UPI0003072E68|nr:hypothetical protein [Piscirickettsia salmonis]QNR81509.1 hypothetical protein ICC15_06130 [Piscirickettsia salmonis]